MNDKAEIESQIQDVYTNTENPHHAGHLRGEQAAKDHVSGLFRAAYGGPDEPSSPPPPPANVASQPAATTPQPAENIAEPLGHDAPPDEGLFEELRTRPAWKDFDAALATANQEGKFLWREGNLADETIFDRLLSHPIATHPDMFEVMLKAGQDRARIGTAPTPGTDPLTLQQEQALVLQTASYYFGKLQGNPVFEQFIETIGTDAAAWQWAVNVGRRLFGR